MTECPYCKIGMKKTKMPMTFKLSPSVIVQEVNIHECSRCGFQSVPEDEAEKVRKLVNSVRETAGKSKLVLV